LTAVAAAAVCAAVFPYVQGISGFSGQFTSRVNLVEVYATVTGPDGQFIDGLTARDFIVEEDGMPRNIEVFASEGFALAVAVGLDHSFSVPAATLAATAAAARTFIDALAPRDSLMVIGIGSETEVMAPLDTDRRTAQAALSKVQRWGTTPLYDAAIKAIDAVQSAAGRRALILLSDGVDRYSRTTGPELVEYARGHDVLVYPVSIGRTREPIWAELASVSGGRSFVVPNVRELNPTLQTIAGELRHQYLLGYSPLRDGRSGWRSIRVRVNRPHAQVRARDGYQASSL
jgi:Ca-activated chloride channel family protein